MMTPQIAANARSFTSRSERPSRPATDRTRVPTSDLSHVGVLGGLQYSVVYDVDQWVATEDVTGMYGEGDTPDDAFHDLAESLRELRGHLEYYADRLSNSQAAQLALLRRG